MYLKKTLSATALAMVSLSAIAADYFIVAPLPGAVAAISKIDVALTQATLPKGNVGVPYEGFDFKPLLTVTGDAAFRDSYVKFSAANLPEGLELSPAGYLSGTPTAIRDGGSFEVVATYKTKTGQQAYTINVGGALLQVTQLVAGQFHTCGLTLAGGVKCWGWNMYGALGIDSDDTYGLPVDVVGLTSGVKSITAGDYHTCAVTSAGAAKCWGWNLYGTLGTNSAEDSWVPVDVVGLSEGVASINAGGFHTCAVQTSGGLKCWGDNQFGQLGNGALTESLVPVAVSGFSSGVASVSVGRHHTCAVTTAGAAKCWGYNGNGTLGTGNTTDSAVPVTVSGLESGVASIGSGDYHSCALTKAGALKCWGLNGDGQLGNNSNNSASAPVGVTGLSEGVASMSIGATHSCAVTKLGGVKCWGLNSDGQLGNNSKASSKVPVDVVGLTGVRAVEAGGFHTCAITAVGTAKCWGNNDDGELGDYKWWDSPVPVEVLAP